MKTGIFRPGRDVGKPAYRRHGKGFTLFEVMVTVAVLSIGLVAIYEALFTCLNAFGYYKNYLAVQSWANEQLWIAEDQIIRGRSNTAGNMAGNTAGNTAGEVMIGNKKVSWRMSASPAGAAGLYQLRLTCSWREGPREVNVSRVVYAVE